MMTTPVESAHLAARISRDQIQLPAAILSVTALRDNLRWMGEFCRREKVEFAPHGKTSMIPEVFRMQMEAGAIGISVAQASHIALAAQAGATTVIVANLTTATNDLAAMADALAAGPVTTLFAFVDSAAAVTRIADSLRAWGKPLSRRPQLLLECGVDGGRCGVRSLDDAEQVFVALRDARDVVDFSGIAGFEGSIAGGGALEDRVADFVGFIRLMAQTADARGAFTTDSIVLSAGGSKFFDIVATGLHEAKLSRPTQIILRSGCQSFSDHGMYQTALDALVQRSSTAAALPPLRPALRVLAPVQSRPEPQLMVVGAGKRHMPFDAGLPKPLFLMRDGEVIDSDLGTVRALNDQHTIIDCPAECGAQVGDVISFGISHPCTLFDKWRSILAIDEDTGAVTPLITHF